MGFSLPAWANGMRSHLVITEGAIDALPAGPLKTLLQANKQAVLSGSYFPDSGYAARDDYGEMAHWEPFLGAFLQHIRATFKDQPLDKGEAAKYVAFLMGAASHSMADQCFDTLFMARTREQDGKADELDIAGDIFLVIWKKSEDPPEFWVPLQDAAKVFKQLGHTVSEGTLKRGMSLARTAQITLRLLAESDYERLKKELPWSHNNYLNAREPGALPYLSKVIANYWQVLWRRLHGENAMNQALLVSQPAPNATQIGVDANSVTSQLTFFFGYPLLKKSYTDANLLVENLSTGKPIPLKISWWGARDGANTLKLRPKADLTYDTEYKVTLQTGLKNLDDQPLPQPVSFTFRTRPKTQPEPQEPQEPQEPNETHTEPASPTSESPTRDGSTTQEPSNTVDQTIDPSATNETSPSPGCGCQGDAPSWWSLWLFLCLLGWLQLLRRPR